MHLSERKPRILFVGAFPPEEQAVYGGIVSSCRTLLKSTLSQDVEFLLLDSTQKINPPPGIVIRIGHATKRFLQFIVRVVGERPDATLIFLSAGASVVEKGMMAWVAKAFGVRVLLFPRAGRVIDSAGRSRFIRAATRILLRPADVLLCQSNAWQRFACTELKVPEDRTLVIENWTASSELLAVGSRRPDIAARTGPLRATFVGWVERNKGIFELLEAFSKVSHVAGIHLQIVGDGRARAAAEINAQRLGIADRVHFLGWLSSVPLRAVLEQSDVFILPSWAEGLPNAMIEAMAARLPVIVTNVGGIPDVIEDRVSGFLVEPQSTENLAAVIQEVLNREDIGRAVADAGFDVASDRFSVAKAVRRFRVGFEMALRSPV